MMALSMSNNTITDDSTIPSDGMNQKKVARSGRADDKQIPLVEQIKTALSIPWVRVAVVVGVVATSVISYQIMSGENASNSVQIEGRDGVNAATTHATYEGDINAEQADYLTEKIRAEAQQKANSGETNALILVTPTPTTPEEQARLATEQEAAATAVPKLKFDDDGNVIYTANGLDVSMDTRRFKKMTLPNGQIYFQDTIDGSEWYTNRDTSELTLRQPQHVGANQNVVAGYNTQSQPANTLQQTNSQSNGQTSFDNTQATYQVNQSQQGGNQTPGGNGGNGGTGNGNGGQDYAAPVYDANQDPDIAHYRSAAAASYDDYAQKSMQYDQNQANQQAALLQQQQQLEAQRRQQAGQALGTVLQRVSALHAGGSTFTTQTISTPTQKTNGNATSGYAQFGTSNADNIGVGQQTATPAATNKRLGETDKLPNHIIRAGTQYSVVITRTANSDHSDMVEGRIVNGPFAGSVVYGQMIPQGRNAGVMFTTIQRPDPRQPLLSIQAVAENIGTRNAQVTAVNRHYMQNYGHIAVMSALQGYGDAYANSGTVTTIERSDGSIITQSQGKNTDKEVLGNIAQNFSSKLQQDMAHLGNRPPTFIISAGQVLTMRLTRDWDTTQTANALR